MVPYITAVGLLFRTLELTSLACADTMPYERKFARTDDSRCVHAVNMVLRQNQYFYPLTAVGVRAVMVINTRLVVVLVVTCPFIGLVGIQNGYVGDGVCRQHVQRKDDGAVTTVLMVGVTVHTALAQRTVAERVTAACADICSEAGLALRKDRQVQYMLGNHIACPILINFLVLSGNVAYHPAP